MVEGGFATFGGLAFCWCVCVWGGGGGGGGGWVRSGIISRQNFC